MIRLLADENLDNRSCAVFSSGSRNWTSCGFKTWVSRAPVTLTFWDVLQGNSEFF